MKRAIRLFVAISLLTALPFLTNAQTESPGAKDDVSAQNDAPDTRGPGGGGPAPVGGGLFILLGLGAAYGGKKLYHLNK